MFSRALSLQSLSKQKPPSHPCKGSSCVHRCCPIVSPRIALSDIHRVSGCSRPKRRRRITPAPPRNSVFPASLTSQSVLSDELHFYEARLRALTIRSSVKPAISIASLQSWRLSKQIRWDRGRRYLVSLQPNVVDAVRTDIYAHRWRSDRDRRDLASRLLPFSYSVTPHHDPEAVHLQQTYGFLSATLRWVHGATDLATFTCPLR